MLETLHTAEDVERASVDLFGAPLAPRPAVSHITALWQSPSEPTLQTIHIDEQSPKDRRDWFALHLSRARADAIVVTGKTLRDEPKLAYNLPGLKDWGDALIAWRKERWGLADAPWLLVLTSGKGLAYDHPALNGWTRPVLFTTDRGARRQLADAPVPVVADESPTLRSAIRYLHRERDAKCVSIEAGPSTSRTLYGEGCTVDEVLLSTYAGELPDANRGGPLWSLEDLRQWFDHETTGTLNDAQWDFRRFTAK